MHPDIVGWAASIILLATLAKQVHKQWKSGSCDGVSSWLFVGQTAASIGFTIYSLLLRNWVYVVTNGALLVNAFLGLYVYRRNCKRQHGTVPPLRASFA